MNNEDYCTLEQSKILKELGFNWDAGAFYNILDDEKILQMRFPENFNNIEWAISAPTLSQAAKWFREKGIGITVQIYTKEKRDWGPNYFDGVFYRPFFTSTKDAHTMGIINKDFNSYEEALRAGIDGALKKLNHETQE